MRKGKIFLGSTMVSALVIGAVVAAVFLAPMGLEHIGIEQFRGWESVRADDNTTYTSGMSGLLEIFIYPHSADPATDYASNLSDTDAFANLSAIDKVMEYNNPSYPDGVPHSEAFDVVVKVRYNQTHAYNSTRVGGEWMFVTGCDMEDIGLCWIQCNITALNLSVNPTNMTGIMIENNTDELYINFYINNGGSGYTIARGDEVYCDLDVKAYF